MLSALKISPCLWFDDQAEEAARLDIAELERAHAG
jgi:predicted 3-demethylubiquinone-9 3-methyltransferase (glyoxalase superfamily)